MNPQDIDILELLPQRPPFVMVDHLTAVDDVRTEAEFTIRPDNILVKDGVLVAEALIECMAQTCAARLGYLNRESDSIKIGYIGAVRNYRISRLPQVGETIKITVDITGQVFQMYMTEVRVSVHDETLAVAELKIAISDNEVAKDQ